jgi:hypothetical protein
MQSAVKPGIRGVAQAVVKGQQSPIVMTLLKEGVNVSPAGIERLTGIIDASNQAVKDALDAIPSSGSIDANAVADRLDALVAKYSKGANPEANVSAVKAVKDEFLRNHGTPQSLMQAQQGLSPAEAQAIKQQTYQDLKETAYGSVKTASIEGQKEIARGLKEGIESEAQRTGQANVRALNAREGAAISTRDEVAKRIASAGNRDPVALAWLAHNPTAGMMFLMERSPAVKSLLARGLYQSAALAANVPTSVMSTILRGLAVGAQGDEK